MKMKIVKGSRDTYKDIMIAGDPEIKSINNYIDLGTLIAMYDDNNKCVGVCHYSETDKHKVELNNISLLENLRGKGLGTKLLKYTINNIFECGYDCVELGTGNSSIFNLAFYQKNGFELTEIWHNYFIDKYDNPIFENNIQ